MKHYAQVFGFDILSRGLFAGVNILLVRLLSANELSSLTVAMTVVATVAQTLAWPTNRLYILSKDATEVDVAHTFLGAQVLGTVVLAVAVLPAQRYLAGTYAAAMLLALGMTATEFAKTYYQKRLRFLAFSTAELARSVLVVVAVVGMVAMRHLTAVGMVFAQGVANFGIAIVLLARIGLLRPPNIRASARLLVSIFTSEQKYLVLYFMLVAVFPNVQPLVLKAASSTDAVATYGSAFRYYSVLLLALNTAHVVLLPSLQSAKTTAEMRSTFRTHAMATVIFACGMAVLLLVCGWAIPIVDKGRYPEAIPTFRILCVSATISFALSPYINMLLVRHDHRAICLAMVVGLVGNVALSIVLVQRYGSIGAASATLLANGIVNVWVVIRALRYPISMEAVGA